MRYLPCVVYINSLGHQDRIAFKTGENCYTAYDRKGVEVNPNFKLQHTWQYVSCTSREKFSLDTWESMEISTREEIDQTLYDLGYKPKPFIMCKLEEDL